MTDKEKPKLKSLIEGASESTVACLITMVQGNVLSLTLGHLFIASQTGVVAGGITFAVNCFVFIRKYWFTPILLGTTTTVVDFYVHPGSFGPAIAEAIVTGVAAGLLSFCISYLIRKWRKD